MAPRPLTPEALRARRSRPRSLARACHEGELEGGLSLSLQATPDEVVGGLTWALGGPARELRVTDVRTGPPLELVIEWRGQRERWDVEGLEALVQNLNDLLRGTESRVAVVLGEWEDMLQLWCVQRAQLRPLLEARLLDEARNLGALRGLTEGSAGTPDEG